jgi:hypothetical protein
MGYDRCKTCGKFHWDHVKCDPIFKVFDEDYMGDDSKEFHASNHEDAALEYASYYNTHCDYSLMNSEREVIVENDDGIKKKFTITAEPSVHYSASEV